MKIRGFLSYALNNEIVITHNYGDDASTYNKLCNLYSDKCKSFDYNTVKIIVRKQSGCVDDFVGKRVTADVTPIRFSFWSEQYEKKIIGVKFYLDDISADEERE